MSKKGKKKIIVELTASNFFRRWPCTVCGGVTEKVGTLAEAADGSAVRVCETCLEAGNIDERLERHAENLKEYAEGIRSLIGRLKVPSFEAWQLAEAKNDLQHWQREINEMLAESGHPMSQSVLLAHIRDHLTTALSNGTSLADLEHTRKLCDETCQCLREAYRERQRCNLDSELPF